MKYLQNLFASLLLSGLVTSNALAAQGDILVRVGGSNVDPDTSSTPLDLDVDDDTSLTFTVAYFLQNNWAVELLGAYPFEHDISLAGAGDVAETKHLPPTLSLQYHFRPAQQVRPYVGVGVNYTYFYDVNTKGALAGTNLSLKNSWGPAAQVGLDVGINQNWFVNADIRYVYINTTAKVSGVGPIADVDIDPFIYTLAVGYKF